MDEKERRQLSRDRLAEVRIKLASGYAYDIITDVLGRKGEEEPIAVSLLVGDLFRTLVLDECWDIVPASRAYYDAMILIGEG